MKIRIKKFVFFVFSFFLFFAAFAAAEVSAQIGGGQSANLGKSISSEVNGRLGSGIFARLGKKPVAKKTTAKKTQTAKTAKGKTPPAKSGKTTAKIQPVETDDFTDYGILTYKPDSRLNTAQRLVNEFAETSDEKTLILTLFNAAKTGYDEEAAKKGKKNDVALALSFFLASCITVYNDAPAPSDQAFDNMYDALAESLLEDEQFAASTDREKQEMSETLIYIGGLVLGGYTIGKESNDEETVRAFQNLAGVSLTSLSQLDPEKMSFNKDGLVVNP